MRIRDLLLDAFWPQRCTLCERFVDAPRALHERCVAALPRVESVPARPRLLHERPPMLAHFADGPTFFRVLHEIKFGRRPRLLDELAPPLAQRGVVEGWLLPQSILVPLPDDPRRRRERGYSVTGLLAERIAGLVGARVDPHLLGRRAGGVAQAQLTGASARQRNQEERWVSGALDRQPLESPLLLIEDQITTGATASAALRRLGARGHRVACVALASSAAAPGMLLT